LSNFNVLTELFRLRETLKDFDGMDGDSPSHLADKHFEQAGFTALLKRIARPKSSSLNFHTPKACPCPLDLDNARDAKVNCNRVFDSSVQRGRCGGEGVSRRSHRLGRYEARFCLGGKHAHTF
jgi:hypothetical protein